MPVTAKSQVNIFWFRRDLRLTDNTGLYHALRDEFPVLPIFIFDRDILDELEDRKDARVDFIYQAIEAMQQSLIKKGTTLDVRYGKPAAIFHTLLTEYDVRKVFTNHDYEPYARQRDTEIAALLKENGISFHSYKDQVIFEKNEVVKDDQLPYTVFTPYSRKWKNTLTPDSMRSFPAISNIFFLQPERPVPALADMNFFPSGIDFPPIEWNRETILQYKEQRNIPAAYGTSRLSIHLRFGTISIRQLAREAGALNETFLNELIWREFYQMILWHFPAVVDRSFKPAYDKIEWRNNEQEFQLWCIGKTGYPIVDAGMRELNTTGFMHNRVRMIVASFLVKHLLIDWRWGEAYFASKLLDYELASNNGGWQWAAGSGCDSAPYFRVFNPYLQTKKFDPELKYIRKWVAEFDSLKYPLPIVEHDYARKRCLEVFAKALRK